MVEVDFALEAVKRVRYYIEVSGAYALNKSGSVSYKDVRTTSSEMTLTQEFLDNNTQQQLIDAAQPKIRSRRRCDLTFGSYLVSHATVVSGTTMPITSPQSDLIGTIMGGISYTTGSEAKVVTNAGVMQEGSEYDKFPGTAIGMIDSATGRLECSRVKLSSSSGLTLDHKLPFTPSAADPIYGGNHCFFADDPNTSLQFYVQGQDNNDTWVLQGLQGNFKLAFANGELSTVEYNLAGGADWSSGSADAVQVATYTSGDPLAIVDARVLFYPVGGTGAAAYVSIDANSWEISPNITYGDITTPNGVNNILRKKRERSVPVLSGKVTTYFHDTAMFAARDADTRYGMAIQIGSTPGQTVYISCPYVQITDIKRVDADNKSGTEISFEALDAKDSTGADRQLSKSSFSVHFL